MPLYHSENVDIPYVPKFEFKDLAEKKLTQEYEDGSSRSVKLPMFDPKDGLEALLFVEREFRKAMEDLDLEDQDDGKQWFRHFDKLMIGAASTRWQQLIQGIANNDRTIARYNQAVRSFYISFCGSRSRDKLIEYIQTIRKPRKVDPRSHSSRMQQLADFANKLPGDMPELTEFQIKQYIYNSFPDSWKIAYTRTGKRVASETLADIIEFMSNEKEIADHEEASRNKKKGNTSSDSDNDHKGRRNGKKGGKYLAKKNGSKTKKFTGRPQPEEQCRLHPDHDHKWIECFKNPDGPNFKPRRSGARPYTNRGGHSGQGNQSQGQSNVHGNSYHNTPVNDNRAGQNVPDTVPPNEIHHLDGIGTTPSSVGNSWSTSSTVYSHRR